MKIAALDSLIDVTSAQREEPSQWFFQKKGFCKRSSSVFL